MSEPLVIAHLSDLHLGAHAPASAAAIAAEVTAFQPGLTVVTGDHTMRARPREFREAAALLDELPQPRLVVPGNHDLPLVSPLRFTAPYDRYRRWIGPDEPVVCRPGLAAMGLNSMPWWRWKSGRVTYPQTVRLRRAMGCASPHPVRVIALHHPPLAGGLARLVGRSRLMSALRAARVDVVLAGHTHVPSVHRMPDGPLIVVAGTATSHRVREIPRSWTLLRVTGDAIEVHERFESAPGVWHTGRVVRHRRPEYR